jgi:hypothetical protein
MLARVREVIVGWTSELRRQRSRDGVATIPSLVNFPRLRSATTVGTVDTTNPLDTTPLAGDEVEGQGESMPVQSRS